MLERFFKQIMDYLCIRRLEQGLSQRGLARATGIPQPSLSEFETYRTAPSLRMLFRLFQALGIRATLVLWRGSRIDRQFELGATPPASAPSADEAHLAKSTAETPKVRVPRRARQMPWHQTPIRILHAGERRDLLRTIGLDPAA